MESASPPRQNYSESMAATRSPERPTRWKDNGIVVGVCVLLVAAVWLVFGQTVRHQFLNYDDNLYFSANPKVQAGLTWNGMRWAFRTGYASNWHPLTWLSLMLDVDLFGTGPMGPHLTNVLLHAANTVLLFLLLKQLTGLCSDKSVGATAASAGTLWPSAFVAAVFAIHPLHVESVAWVAERKDVLSGLFFMLTLLMYARYAQNSFKSQVSDVRWWASRCYWLAVLFFALGLMSKPMLVTLPFVLLLLDYWPLGRVTRLFSAPARQVSDPPLPSFGTAGKWRMTKFRIPVSQLRPESFRGSSFNHILLEKLPFVLLSIASCVATVLTQQGVIKSTVVLPLTLRFGNALMAYVTYLVQMVWPDNLAVFYPYYFDVPLWQIAGAGVLLLVVTVVVMVAAKRFPYLPVGWLWYLGMLVPVIGLVQVGEQSHADRYTYLPQIGLSLAVVWAVRDFTASWRYRRQVLGTAAGIVIAALMGCAWKQTAYWRNNEFLWMRALACTSGNYIAYTNLGASIMEQGRFTEAIGYYQKALELNPDNVETHNDWGMALMEQGQNVQAIGHFQKAIEINPNCAEAHNNLGILLAKQGRIAEAIEHYQWAIALNPNRAEFYDNLGNLLTKQSRIATAVEQFQKALEVDPDYAKAHYNLANVFIAQGRWNEAIEHYQQALKQMPDSVHAHYQLGLALQSRDRFAEAVVQLQKVLELDPKHISAQNNLAWLLATCPDNSLRDGQEAVALAQQAVQFSGGNAPEILDTLAAAYAEAGRYPEAVETARRALDLSAAQNKKSLAEVIQNQLKLFESHSPYREKP